MNGARLIKRKEAERREQQGQDEATRAETFAPTIDTVLNWRSRWQSSERPNAREAFAALFANPRFSGSHD
jgi:hypothetical protein